MLRIIRSTVLPCTEVFGESEYSSIQTLKREISNPRRAAFRIEK
jgi:hypothetical protein